MKNKLIGWSFDVGFYPGILLGFRTYEKEWVDEETMGEFKQENHVLYLPFIDFNLTIHYYNEYGE